MIRVASELRDEIRAEAYARRTTIQSFVTTALWIAVRKARSARMKREQKEMEAGR